jgi:hypothetical protein
LLAVILAKKDCADSELPGSLDPGFIVHLVEFPSVPDKGHDDRRRAWFERSRISGHVISRSQQEFDIQLLPDDLNSGSIALIEDTVCTRRSLDSGIRRYFKQSWTVLRSFAYNAAKVLAGSKLSDQRSDFLSLWQLE